MKVCTVTKFSVFLVSIFLISCGGGNNGLPNSAPEDIESPYIISTIPNSEKDNVSTTKYIYVTFNEDIKTVTTDQVSIYPFIDGSIDTLNPVMLNNDSFIFDTITNKLEIQIKVGDLIPKTKYQVLVDNVYDLSGNALQNPCLWEFTTIDAPAIISGKTGVCGVLEKAPSEVNKVVAISGDKKVLLFWGKPSYGTADNYQIHVTSNSQGTYGPVKLDLTGDLSSFIDRKVENNKVYTYMVRASNSIGKSAPTFSNSVTPTVGFISIVPSSELLSNNPNRGDDFGFAIAISPDGLTLAIGEPNGDPNIAPDSGNVQLFVKSGSVWKRGPVLLSDLPVTGNRFGSSVAFSPDGKTLAIGETFGDFKDAQDAGAVHVFNKTGTDWEKTPNRGQKLKSQIFTTLNRFGTTVTFSPDSKTIAIGEVLGDPTTAADAGTVQLFINIDGTWNSDALLTAKAPTTGNGFGRSLSFSPDGQALVVGETGLSPTSNTGAVHLFVKLNDTWSHTQVLQANIPSIANGFGICVAFSPDSSTLAVGEFQGDLNKVTDSGSVQLFIKSKLTWADTPIKGAILSSQIPRSQNKFGKSVSFSPDGITLSVGEILGGNITNVAKSGTVQHFSKAGADWVQVPSRGPMLRPTTTTNASYFGNTLVFSPDGSILIVGELYGLQDTGQVSIFDTSQPVTTVVANFQASSTRHYASKKQ